MKPYFIKSFFVFDPSLKHEKRKPTEAEMQEAKCLFYYPIYEDTMVKTSNTGIIEGTFDLLNNFGEQSEFLFTELDKHYYIAKKHRNLYLTFILEKTIKDTEEEVITQNTKEIESVFKEYVSHFLRTFEFFNGEIEKYFTCSKKAENEASSYYQVTVDFLLKFQENTELTRIFSYQHIPYMPLRENQYVNLMYSAEILLEQHSYIHHCAVFYRGYLVHYDVALKELSTLYAQMYSNVSLEAKFPKFSMPEKRVVTNMNVGEQDEMRENNYNKAFKIEGESGFLMGIKPLSINTFREFIPSICFSDGKKFKLVSYLLEGILIVLFLDADFEANRNWNKITKLEENIETIFSKNTGVLSNIYFQRSMLEEKYQYAYFNFSNRSLKITQEVIKNQLFSGLCLKELDISRENTCLMIKRVFGLILYLIRTSSRCIIMVENNKSVLKGINTMKSLKSEVFDHVYV